jgi:hypothetical protein
MVLNEYWRINYLLPLPRYTYPAIQLDSKKISKKFQWVSHTQKPTSSPVPLENRLKLSTGNPQLNNKDINKKSTRLYSDPAIALM